MLDKKELVEIKRVLKDFGVKLSTNQLEELKCMNSIQAHNKKLELIKEKLA